MATVGSLCEICYVGHYEVDQGLLICDQCGTQSQAYQEEEHEVEGAGALGRGVRRVREPKQPKVSLYDKKQPRDAAKLVRVFCACLQRQLQRQLAFLQQNQGVAQQVEQVAEQIWLANLEACGCFQESFLKTLGEAQPGRRATNEESAEEHSFAYTQQALWKVLPPVTTLLTCFLACWVLREAILPSHIVAWALSGHLPYMDLASELAHVEDHNGMDLRLLHPSGLPHPSRLVQDATKLADRIQLALPPANAAGFISCFCSELSLPKADSWRASVAAATAEEAEQPPAGEQQAAAAAALPQQMVAAELGSTRILPGSN
ncbi:hypothetical protein WJX73_007046 [Symbiochloris irregularis]|uniref:Rrn7/TAF1B N-terminal cyclin domain-containing protein n=1 Tax=Symbiochloris irregularis TaxID=706552 RepID=A0AAW1NXL3_9CHLO